MCLSLLITVLAFLFVVILATLVPTPDIPVMGELFGESPFGAQEASALETDFQLSNESLSSSTISPGSSVLFNFTITNTGEQEEHYRVVFLQDYDWFVEITGIFDENGSSLN